uniref:Uncharacterized protein n=1 Tax=Syphacia muris TaxID=451379 RepID=A0A0N5A836_9BILA
MDSKRIDGCKKDERTRWGEKMDGNGEIKQESKEMDRKRGEMMVRWRERGARGEGGRDEWLDGRMEKEGNEARIMRLEMWWWL